MADGFAQTYGVELLLDATPTVRKATLLRDLRRWCPRAEPLDGDPADGVLAFVHPDHPIQLADGQIHAQTFITVTTQPPEPDRLRAAAGQAWGFAEARSIITRVRASILVTDFMSANLDRRERLDLFQRSLRGTLESIPCSAIYWKASDRIVDARAWIRQFDQDDAAALFCAGAVNARLFRVESSSADAAADLVMDTLGLTALGLPDLQCHFHGLDPGAVAAVLYNTAWYVYTNGDVLQDGHTVEGVETSSRWRCRPEQSLVSPDRAVVDLNPGHPYAAGDRTG